MAGCYATGRLAVDWRTPATRFVGISERCGASVVGQERLHAVFDATQTLGVEALAVLSGALRAGKLVAAVDAAVAAVTPTDG